MDKEIAELLNGIAQDAQRGVSNFDGGNVGTAILGFKVAEGAKDIERGLLAIAEAIRAMPKCEHVPSLTPLLNDKENNTKNI